MTRRSSAISFLRALAGDRRGQAAVGLALLLPALLAATSGTIELGSVMFEHSRATEATRRAARIGAMGDAIADLAQLETTPVECSSTGGTVSCTGAQVIGTATFDQMVASMRAIMPQIGPDNLRVSYEWTGLGFEESGGIKPRVSVRLVGVQHDFVMLRIIPGMPLSITLPEFETSQIGKGFVED